MHVCVMCACVCVCVCVCVRVCVCVCVIKRDGGRREEDIRNRTETKRCKRDNREWR